jgi:hypothetical protein
MNIALTAPRNQAETDQLEGNTKQSITCGGTLRLGRAALSNVLASIEPQFSSPARS